MKRHCINFCTSLYLLNPKQDNSCVLKQHIVKDAGVVECALLTSIGGNRCLPHCEIRIVSRSCPMGHLDK